MNGMNNDWGMGFGWGWIIGIIVLVVLILLLFRAINKKHYPHKRSRNWPVDILKKQYRQTELDKEEIEIKKEDTL
ncbi:SHOCT domain-containing protein [Labilibaculum sp. K2S]|uniref:SHOCT domain-containing protein n=1 Tax=Labilibaculum sp. K2S TaxID=3056386 RepID=UPI0025A4433E|nr:SHOCT domain-containing protein [Labilibaculum sp. K2S]MDM8159593.1 SHOCT domain-containing protein [Labilibaculum sp. K2S]